MFAEAIVQRLGESDFSLESTASLRILQSLEGIHTVVGRSA
jgi:hypothetical protein